jgi:hypothetical protein
VSVRAWPGSAGLVIVGATARSADGSPKPESGDLCARLVSGSRLPDLGLQRATTKPVSFHSASTVAASCARLALNGRIGSFISEILNPV